MTKETESFIDLYLRHTDGVACAPILRKWVAYWAVCACAERKVWLRTAAATVYPNLFVMLVAPPGVGKDMAIDPMIELLRKKKTNLSPISMTDKGFLDELGDPARIKEFRPPGSPKSISYSSLNVCVPELGTLFSSHDLSFLSSINDLFGSKSIYEEKVRSRKEKLVINNPFITIMGGTQPSFLSSLFPPEAWGMGFMSRIVQVYHGIPEKKKLFGGSEGFVDLSETREKLNAHIDWLQDTSGPMLVSDDAIEALEYWNEYEKDEDQPDHPKLQHYNARRIVHLFKLCMVFALSDRRMEIQLKDFQNARDALLEVEERMPEIFKEMSSGGHKEISDEALHFMIQIYRKRNKPVSEQRLIEFLARHIPSNQINYVIDNMIKMRMIKEVNQGLNDTRASAQRTKIRLFEPVGLARVEI